MPVVYLIGGDRVSLGGKVHHTILKEIVSEAGKLKTVILNLGSEDRAYLEEHGERYATLFSEYGEAKLVYPWTDKEKALDLLEWANVVYLPGGDTKTMVDNLARIPDIRKILLSKDVLIGNSAGAIVLSLGDRDEDEQVDGIGILPFYATVHYGEYFPRKDVSPVLLLRVNEYARFKI